MPAVRGTIASDGVSSSDEDPAVQAAVNVNHARASMSARADDFGSDISGLRDPAFRDLGDVELDP